MKRACLGLVVALCACSNKDDNNVATPPRDMAMPDMATDSGAEDVAQADVLPDVPAEPGSLVIDPTSITFSDVRQGETASARIGLSNVGGSPIVVTGVRLVELNRTGEPEILEGEEWSASFVLGPNIFRELEVVYEPRDFGVDRGFIELFTNDSEHEIVRISIETVSAYAQLEGPGFLRFGEVSVGSSKTERLTFYNRGLDSLTIDTVDLGGITGTFAITFEANATPPTVLERDEDFIVDVTYTPDAAMTHRGTVTINSDAPDQPTFDVALVGNDPTPCLDVTPDAVDFGEVAAGSNAMTQVTLLNCSQTLNLEVSDIVLADDGGGAFALGTLPALPAQIAPLQTVQFPITGTLPQPGVATGEIQLSSTDPSSSGVVGIRLTVPEN